MYESEKSWRDVDAYFVDTLIADGTAPYDFVFIDADKPSNPAYLKASLALTRPGSVIVIDNVVRNGAVTDPASRDERVLGVRAVLADIAGDDRLEATALLRDCQSVDGPGGEVHAAGVGKTEPGPESAGVRQADAGRQPHGHRHAVGSDDQRPFARDAEVLGDGGVEALGDLGPRFPVGMVYALDILAAKPAVVALPGLDAPDLGEPQVTVDRAGRLQGLPGLRLGAGHQ